jgi:hypothetical protein
MTIYGCGTHKATPWKRLSQLQKDVLSETNVFWGGFLTYFNVQGHQADLKSDIYRETMILAKKEKVSE